MWIRLALLLCLIASIASAASVQWNASVVDAGHGTPDGYRVYYGLSADQLTTTYDVGNQLNFPIPETWNPATYYFGVRAYNQSGESGWATTPEGQTWVSYVKADPPPVLPPEPATDVRIVFEPIEEPPVMARVLSESFEGTGYDLTWTEIVDSGNTVNEDSSGPGTLPTGGGSQCLLVQRVNSAKTALAYYDHGGNITASRWIRIYVYVDTASIPDGSSLLLVAGTADYGATPSMSWSLQLARSGSDYFFRAAYHESAGYSYINGATISFDIWYRIELEIGGAAELRVDGTTQGSRDTSVSLDRNWRYTNIGFFYGENEASATIYYDLFAIDDADWVGAGSGGSSAVPKIMLLQDHFSGGIH